MSDNVEVLYYIMIGDLYFKDFGYIYDEIIVIKSREKATSFSLNKALEIHKELLEVKVEHKIIELKREIVESENQVTIEELDGTPVAMPISRVEVNDEGITIQSEKIDWGKIKFPKTKHYPYQIPHDGWEYTGVDKNMFFGVDWENYKEKC